MRTSHSIHLHEDSGSETNQWSVERHQGVSGRRDVLIVAGRSNAADYDGLEFDIFGSKEQCDKQLVELIRVSVETLIETMGPEAWVRLSCIIDKTCPDCGAELATGTECRVCMCQPTCEHCGSILDEAGVCPPCYEQQLEDAAVDRHLALVRDEA